MLPETTGGCNRPNGGYWDGGSHAAIRTRSHHRDGALNRHVVTVCLKLMRVAKIERDDEASAGIRGTVSVIRSKGAGRAIAV
jgi:hypothetical protein